MSDFVNLHAKHEGGGGLPFVSEAGRCWKYLQRKQSNEGVRVRDGQGASPLCQICLLDRDASWRGVCGNLYHHENGIFMWVLCQRALACSEGLWRNSVYFFLPVSRLVWEEKSVKFYLFFLDTYIFMLYIYLFENIFFTVKSMQYREIIRDCKSDVKPETLYHVCVCVCVSSLILCPQQEMWTSKTRHT